MTTRGTVAHSLWRGFMSFVAFSVPMLVFGMPTNIQSMTIGAFLMAVAHFAASKLGA